MLANGGDKYGGLADLTASSGAELLSDWCDCQRRAISIKCNKNYEILTKRRIAPNMQIQTTAALAPGLCVSRNAPASVDQKVILFPKHERYTFPPQTAYIIKLPQSIDKGELCHG